MRHTFRIVAAAAAVLMIGAVPASAQKQKLRFANWVPPTHTMTPLQIRWYKLIEKYSNGNIEVAFDKAAVAKPRGQYDLIKSGVRDIVWHIPGYTPGRQELLRVAEGPFKSPNATYTSPIVEAWYTKHGLDKKEFESDGVHLLLAWMSGGTIVHTTKEATTLDALKDLKVRGAGASVASAKALGLSVVSFPMNDAYDALQRGTITGLLSNFEAIPSFSMTDLLPFHLIVPGSMAATTFVMIMNKKTYNNLSASNRAAVDKASGVFGAAMYGKAWDAADEKAKKLFHEKGHTFNTLSDAELTVWKQKLSFVRQGYIDEANKRGEDGKALMEDFEKMLAAGPEAVMR